jgi:hypothetical protein
MAIERFKVTNTTVKPPRIVNGKDERQPSERVGHFIQFEDEKKRSILLGPGQFAVIGDNVLDEWFIKNEQEGELKITPIKDMGSALEEFRLHAANKAAPVKAKVEPSNIRVAEMGDSGSTTLGEGVTPGGEPNFVVKAKSAQTLAKEKLSAPV